MPTKAEERSMIQISFWTQDSTIKTGTIRNPLQNSQLIHHPLYIQNPRIRSIYHKNPQSVRFLLPNPSIPKPLHPPLTLHRLSGDDNALGSECKFSALSQSRYGSSLPECNFKNYHAVLDLYKTWTGVHGPLHGPGPWTTMDHP